MLGKTSGFTISVLKNVVRFVKCWCLMSHKMIIVTSYRVHHLGYSTTRYMRKMPKTFVLSNIYNFYWLPLYTPHSRLLASPAKATRVLLRRFYLSYLGRYLSERCTSPTQHISRKYFTAATWILGWYLWWSSDYDMWIVRALATLWRMNSSFITVNLELYGESVLLLLLEIWTFCWVVDT